MADLRGGGARDARPRVQILSISCSFWEKMAKSYVGTPLGGLAPPPREILHPPLSAIWINYLLQCTFHLKGDSFQRVLRLSLFVFAQCEWTLTVCVLVNEWKTMETTNTNTKLTGYTPLCNVNTNNVSETAGQVYLQPANVSEGNVFSHVCPSVIFVHRGSPPYTVPPHPGHVQTCSGWTSLYRDPEAFSHLFIM